MADTKADRSAAAKKAAATRERNQQRTQSEVAGKKAASTRQMHAAEGAADQARRRAKQAGSGVLSGGKTAARLTGIAAREATKAVATRLTALVQGGAR